MDLEKQAIEILQTFNSADDPYIIADSGGKDSSVLKFVAIKAGVNLEIEHDLTTVDAPETVQFVKEDFKRLKSQGIKCHIEYPPTSMWRLIEKKGTPPTRLIRYCCEVFKEGHGKGRKVCTGVRKAESKNRKDNQGIITFPKPLVNVKKEVDNAVFHSTDKGGVVVLNYENSEVHRVVENCYRTSKTLINPLLEWDDEYLWWYIRKNQIVLNPAYKNGCPGGCRRIGCIGCPMGGDSRWDEFTRYPKYKDAYIRAFDRMLIARNERGLKNMDAWSDGQKVFKWWMEDNNVDGQYSFDLAGNITEDYT